jgi:uncharacterized protein (TIGR03067 family)
MKSRILISVIGLFFIAAAVQTEDETKRDLQKIQGTWAFVAIEGQGAKKSERELAGTEDELNWTFKDDELIRNLGMEFVRCKFELDATKQPKEIDLPDYGGKGNTVRGIYAFEGELLKVFLGSKDGERPLAFESARGVGQAYLILKPHVVKNKDS